MLVHGVWFRILISLFADALQMYITVLLRMLLVLVN